MFNPGLFGHESLAHAENLFDKKLSIPEKQGAPTYGAPRLLRGGEKTLGRASSRLGPRVVLLFAFGEGRFGFFRRRWRHGATARGGSRQRTRGRQILRHGHAAHKQERGSEDAPLDAAGFHFVALLDLRVAISTRTGSHSYPILRREMSRRYWPSVQVSRGAT